MDREYVEMCRNATVIQTLHGGTDFPYSVGDLWVCACKSCGARFPVVHTVGEEDMDALNGRDLTGALDAYRKMVVLAGSGGFPAFVRDSLEDESMAYVWLPRADQLLRIILGCGGNEKEMFESATAFSANHPEIEGLFRIEKILLITAMSRRAGKTWNGNDWVTENRTIEYTLAEKNSLLMSLAEDMLQTLSGYTAATVSYRKKLDMLKGETRSEQEDAVSL